MYYCRPRNPHFYKEGAQTSPLIPMSMMSYEYGADGFYVQNPMNIEIDEESDI